MECDDRYRTARTCSHFAAAASGWSRDGDQPHSDGHFSALDVAAGGGLSAGQVTFNLHENDKRLIEFGRKKVIEIMRAAGATEVEQESRFAHLVGACRMSATPDAGVCDKFGRTWDVPNLFVMDGSVMPTQGSANPGLTIQALAARTADYLISHRQDLRSVLRRDFTEPPCRLSLSPPGTFLKGAPHLR